MSETVEHLDVVVVGAGISGIGAGYHLETMCPDRSYTILEGRDSMGGTWDLFRYPGIRSDSDMHTLGYSFRPWTGEKALADGPSILAYLKDTATEFGVDKKIRYRHLVNRAEWSSETSQWTVHALHRDDDDTEVERTYTCNFLFLCAGYYSYKGGHTPDFAGRERFTGDIVHPQKWPEDLDYTNKRVVVIGSGATAVTLVPAMAEDAAHVTMLQRSPSYVVSVPGVDPIAKLLRRVLPEKRAFEATRWKNVQLTNFMYKQTRVRPERIKKMMLGRVRKALGPDYDVDKHFTPSYNPWDQRVCAVPDDDLFNAINSGKASVVTDHIKTFTETGIELESGESLEADIIITATGLTLAAGGEAMFTVDGEPVDFAKTWTYKGMGFSDVPNLMTTFGYIAASWTLRADLVAEYVCRVLNHMTATGTTQCTPRLRGSDSTMPERPYIDDFSAGYIQRMLPMLPKQGDRQPWMNTQDYLLERELFAEPVNDGVMLFTTSEVREIAPVA